MPKKTNAAKNKVEKKSYQKSSELKKKSVKASDIFKKLMEKLKEVELAYNLSPKLTKADRVKFKARFKAIFNSQFLILSALMVADPSDFHTKHTLVYSLGI